jgi:hypothetical protein
MSDLVELARLIRSDDDDESYCAFYCEENAIRLATRLRQQSPEVFVVFISNAIKAVPLWRMRCGDRRRDLFVAFDYHVVVVARSTDRDGERWIVVDMDFVNDDDDGDDKGQGHIIEFDKYYARVMKGRVRGGDADSERKFRIVALDEIEREFKSDRSHMRDKSTGAWLATPPTWDCLFGATQSNLFASFVDMSVASTGPGRVVSELELIELFGKSVRSSSASSTHTTTVNSESSPATEVSTKV